MTDAVDPPQALGVDVRQISVGGSLVAHDGLNRIQCLEPRMTMAFF